MKNIFLAGGGSERDSWEIDKKFVETLDRAKPLVYIPNAAGESEYPACLEWFKSAMAPLGVGDIGMWDNLNPRRSIDEISGIYLGGGGTGKLLEELRDSGFAEYLVKAAGSGVPVYGGSAGAIILGKDVRTDQEIKGGLGDYAGLDLIEGFSVFPHYSAKQAGNVSKLARDLDLRIIAVPEKSGVRFSGTRFVAAGYEPILIFSPGGYEIM